MLHSFPPCFSMILLVAALAVAADEHRPRTRDLGIAPGVFPPGPLNAITDVRGVRVGQTTVNDGEEIHTGVTAVLPHGGNLFQEKVAGAVFVGNAFGKLAGSTQVQELGTIETPIVLTNTLAVGTALEAVVAYTLAQPGNESVRSVNAAGRRDERLGPERHPPHADPPGPRPVGDRECQGRPCGGGKCRCGDRDSVLRLEGGHRDGLALLPQRHGGYTLGVLVQTNFGGVLTIAGAPVGKELGRYAFAPPDAKAAGPGW